MSFTLYAHSRNNTRYADVLGANIIILPDNLCIIYTQYSQLANSICVHHIYLSLCIWKKKSETRKFYVIKLFTSVQLLLLLTILLFRITTQKKKKNAMTLKAIDAHCLGNKNWKLNWIFLTIFNGFFLIYELAVHRIFMHLPGRLLLLKQKEIITRMSWFFFRIFYMVAIQFM